MSVFKKQAVVATRPAFNIVRREADSKGYINITANEVITDHTMIGGWTVSSAVSYALESTNVLSRPLNVPKLTDMNYIG